MEHFVPRRIENCDQKEFILHLRYPLNSVVLYQLKELSDASDKNLEYFKSALNDTNYNIPSFRVLEKVNNSEVLYDKPETGVELDRVVDIIKSQKEVYLSADDLIQLEEVINEKDDLESWFTLNRIELGLTFLMSIFGVISTIITICFCVHYCKGNKYASVISTMLQHPPIVKAAAVEDSATIAYNEFKYRMFLLLAGIICYLLYKIGHWIYKKYVIYKLIIPHVTDQKIRRKCHLYLEIVNGHEKLVIYLISFASSMINIQFNSKTTAEFVSLQGNICSPQLTVKWTKGYCILYNNIRCELPHVIPVPLLSYRKLARMTQSQTYIRPLIFEDVFYHFYPLIAPPSKPVPARVKTSAV